MAPKVDNYMSSPVISVYPHDSIAHVRNLMLKHKISRVVVIDSSYRPIGIVSKSDIVRYFIDRRRAKRSLEEVFVREVMTSPVITIPPSTSIKKAAEILLGRNISSLPVYSPEKGLLGIITATDLLKAFSEHGSGKARASDYMRKDFTIARRNHSIFRVIDLMNKDPDKKVIVVENNTVVGVITETDIVFVEPRSEWTSHSYIKKRKYNATKGFISIVRDYIVPIAEDIMTPDPIVVSEDEDLSTASDLMYKYRIGCLPVVNKEMNVKGLITKRSILRAIKDLL
ncbi:MAG: CBS domain-containing protein [Sulfolobales archaeon]